MIIKIIIVITIAIKKVGIVFLIIYFFINDYFSLIYYLPI